MKLLFFIIGLIIAIFSIYMLLKTKGFKSFVFFVSTIVGASLCLPMTSDDATQNDIEKQEKHCARCLKDLTNSKMNEYVGSGVMVKDVKTGVEKESYYCPPCWKIAWKEAQDDAKAQGY